LTTNEFTREFERRLAGGPDADFRPQASASERIAVFASHDPRDRERAWIATMEDSNKHRVEDTSAGAALAAQKDLSDTDYRRLSLLTEARVAMAARGNVEVHDMRSGMKTDFHEYVVDSLMRNDAITHFNGVPRDLVEQGKPEQQAMNLWASELVRDHRAGRIASLEKPGDYYAGSSGPGDLALRPPEPSAKTPPGILKIAQRFEAVMKAREHAAEIARNREARQNERGRDPSERGF
jgi:hypothetical protein